MKYIIYFVFVVFTITSCNWLQNKVPNQEILFKEEMLKIDWKQVDEPPSLVLCDSIQDKILKQNCLYSELTNIIHYKLNNKSFSIGYVEIDTLWVGLQLNTDSSITIKPNFDKLLDQNITTKLDSILKKDLDSLPKVIPAVKRGIPVITLINLPIIIEK